MINSGKRLLNEDGLVAIVTAMIMTMIISAIVISFTVITRREETQTRDRQLSTQANYAAESGVNYAVRANLPNNTSTCTTRTGIDTIGAISATCILVNDQPNEAIFDEVSTEKPLVMYDTNPVDELRFAFQSSTSSASFSSNYTAGRGGAPLFPTSSNWGTTTGVVEVVIYPVDSTINTTNSSSPNRLVDQAKTFYLYPKSVGGTGTYGSASYSDDGKIIDANCNSGNTPKYCLAKITGIPTAGPGTKGLVIRMRSIYNPTSMHMTGFRGGGAVTINGVQRVIDATGKATDVLRRVQIRLPVRNSYNLPIYAVETGDDLCKLLSVYPNQPASYDPNGCNYASPPSPSPSPPPTTPPPTTPPTTTPPPTTPPTTTPAPCTKWCF